MTFLDNSLRADPDALLSAINKKRSKRRGGRLYLFIGMAPGVGKTYAMLLAAHEAKKSGVDVTIGVVETHGRDETQRLLTGLEIIPRMSLTYRDIAFTEMDLDAILKRKPALVLVDELAHTNVKGARHTKRWQDVFEILDAGIDVYSTLNVQHLESRKSAVEEIAKITVSETVPDSVLDRAFQIQLIDLSVPDLLRRLKEGKVYLGDKAEVAATNFFKEEKLTALREIALRVAAERVDAELQTFATEREAGTFWPAAERLLVAVGYQKRADELIRATRRMAYNLDASWIALHVEVNEMASEQEKLALAKNLELARNLGAEVVNVADTNLVDAIVRIANQRNVTQVIMGRSRPKWLSNLFGRRSTFDQLVERSNVDICVIGPKPQEGPATFSRLFNLRARSSVFSYAKSLIFVSALVAFNAMLAPFIGYRAVGFILLLGILLMGLFVPIGPIMVSSVVTMIAWNFLFIPPVGTFHISQPDDIVLSLLYLVAALATGILTRRIKYQQEILLSREERAHVINNIVLDSASKPSTKLIISSIIARISSFLSGECDVALLKKDLSVAGFSEQRLTISNMTREMAVAKWAIDNNKPAGRFTETLANAEAMYIPLNGTYDMMGALAYQGKKSHAFSVEDMDFLLTAARQLAVALERENFRKRALESERLLESEDLHALLLHDLAQKLKDDSCFKKNSELQFLTDNALLSSRLSVGIFPLKREFCEPIDLINEARSKVSFALANHPLTIKVAPDIEPINVERGLFEQVFANIILNAAQHAPPGTSITISVANREISFIDRGTGVNHEDLGRIFEKFYQADESRKRQGLGLFIAKSVIKAHEGKITASTKEQGGLKISVSL